MSTLLQSFASPEWAQVVKALLHSLWQGAIAALLLAALLRRFTNPVHRYRSSLGALVSVFCVGIITWAVMNAAERRPSLPVLNVVPIEIPSASPVPIQTLAIPAQRAPVKTPEPHAPSVGWTAWLAMAWLAGAAAMLGRAGAKVAGAEKLRRSCQPCTDARILILLAEARRAVGLTRQIGVGITAKLTSPAVTGVFVPMLILPLSLVTALTPDQIRFVLLHELAHIRRGDYLANLFQFFAESLLFFNPAVWWISREIRREREACCDALAIELSGTPADYARTLLHVAENVLNPASVAAPAFGDKREPSSLLERVQRLLVPGYRPSLRLTWRAMLAALLFGSILLVLSAVGTRITVAAILTPQQRIEKIEKKMAEYGVNPETDDRKERIAITGRLTTADGSQLPRNRYLIVHSRGPNYSSISALGLNRDGTFSNAAPAGQIWIEGSAEGFAPTVVGPFDRTKTNRIDAGELVLGRGFDVHLRVTDADSERPIPNAKLRAQFWLRGTGSGLQGTRELQTDASGNALVPHCADVPLGLSINAPGYQITDVRFETLKAGQTLEIKLNPGAIVTGTVTDESTGAPIAGATVRVIHEKGDAESHGYQWDDPVRVLATTDERGQFTANQLRTHVEYWFGVNAAAHESVILGAIRAGDTASVKLGPELIVRGHVVGSVEGLQKINGRASLYLNSSETFDNESVGRGEWVPLNTENGVATFEFTNHTRGLVHMAQSELQVDGPVADWVVDLNKPKTEAKDLPKREVIFRFKSASGVSPRGTVSVTVPDSLETNHLTAHSEEKQITNGEVRVQIAIGGRTSIEAKHMVGFWFDHFGNNGSLLSIPVTNGPGPMVINIPVIPAGAIYAKALNADGSPAGGLMFGIDELKRSPLRTSGLLGGDDDTYSDTAPRKWVSGPLPLGGTYRIHAWRGNSFCISKPITLTEENPDAEVEMQFAAGKVLEGFVLGPDGAALRDVDLKPEFSLPVNRDNNHGFGLKSVFTDSNGRFRIEDVTPGLGEYFIQVAAPNIKAERVRLDFNSQPQTIRLQPGKIIAGRLVESGTGYVIPGAEVRAFDSGTDNMPMQTTHTDSDGRFEFTTLGDVNYTLYVEGGERTWPEDRKFRASVDTNLTLAVKLYDWSKLKPKAPEKPVATAQRTTAFGAHDESKPEVGNHLSATNATASIPITGILTEPQYRVVLHALQQREIQWWLAAQPMTPDKGENIVMRLSSTVPQPVPTNDAIHLTQSTPISSQSATNLLIRTFKVDIQAFHAALEVAGQDIADAGSTQVVPFDGDALKVFSFFKNIGVDMNPTTNPGKTFLFTENNGLLLVRATKRDLELIEPAIAKLNGEPSAGLFREPPSQSASSVSTSNATGQPLRSPQTSPAGASIAATNLVTRTFRINPNTFIQGLIDAGALPVNTNEAPPSVNSGFGAGNHLQEKWSSSMNEGAVVGIRNFFKKLGVDLDPATNPGKAVFFNDGQGSLLVRATTSDLDLIEAAIQMLNAAPEQIRIAAKIVEVTQNNNKAHRFDWYVGNFMMNNVPTNNSAPGDQPTFNGDPSAVRPAGASPTGLIPTYDTKSVASGLRRDGTNAAESFPLTGILTEPQYRTVLRALQQRDGVNILNDSTVATLSGRQTQIQAVDIKYIATQGLSNVTKSASSSVTNMATTPVPLGPTVDIIPTVRPDGYTIHMTIFASLVEFLGYDDPGKFGLQATNGSTGTTPTVLPHFRLYQATANLTVWDGQTIVLGGFVSEAIKAQKNKVPVLGDLTLVGRLFRSESNVSQKKNLMIFITPTLIDPAGNRIHKDDELPMARNSIPPQRSSAR